MTRPIAHRPAPARIMQDEDGAALVELAIVLPVFLLLVFGLIDFGRMGFETVMAEKATDMAVRLAATRPPACTGVPETNARGPVAVGAVPPHYGTSCNAGSDVCADAGTVSCIGDPANATVLEIWDRIAGLMPSNATPANLRFSYAYDEDLGFLGGPYVPVVTVEITDLQFRFASPLGALAALAGGASAIGSTAPFPAMSVSLPAEDLAQGNNG